MKSEAEQMMAEANAWHTLSNGARVHATALVGLQPMRGAAFARPVQDHAAPVLAVGVEVGPYAVLYAGCVIQEDARICPFAHVREGVRIGRRSLVGVGVRIGYNAVIGDDVQILDDTHLSGETQVGDRSLVSVHALAVNDDHVRGWRWKGVTGVIIENDVVVGAGAMLRPGIRIGAGSTIAMGALVVRNVPPGSIVKGPVATARRDESWPEGGCGAIAAAIDLTE